MATEWIQVGQAFGLPVLMLAAIGWFLVKHVWPFVTRQVEDAQRVQTLSRNEFLAALDKIQEAHSKERLGFLEAMERRDREFERLATSVNRVLASIERRTQL